MPAIRPRLRASTMAVSETSATLASRETILCAFEAFRDELDDHNDRRERLIKVCTHVQDAYLPCCLAHRCTVHVSPARTAATSQTCPKKSYSCFTAS